MTAEQEAQLRAILDIEGCSEKEIDDLVADFRRKPDHLASFLGLWELRTETVQ